VLIAVVLSETLNRFPAAFTGTDADAVFERQVEDFTVAEFAAGAAAERSRQSPSQAAEALPAQAPPVRN
jgi:hypothetical protein